MAVYQDLSDLLPPIGEALEIACDAPQNAIVGKLIEGDHLLRTVRYPGSIKKGEEGAAPHTDSNYITILPPATSKGLELFHNNVWIPVVVPEGAVVVNVGSMLEHMTNGYFHSALHRVVKYEDGGDDRYSVAFFVHSRENDSMSPLSSCIAKMNGIQLFPKATRQYLLYQRLFAMGRTTQEMDRKYLESWGGIERWKSFEKMHGPESEIMQEIDKVKEIIERKKETKTSK